MLCQKTALKTSASRPSSRHAVEATTMLWASIILPITPPALLAEVMSTGDMPICSAVTYCRLPKSAFEPASVPVKATPSQPRSVPKKG